MDATANHVGVTVSDLDGMVAFYRDALGFEVLDRFTVDGEAFATAVDVPGASADFAHLAAGGVRLELVAYDPEDEAMPTPDLNRPGTAHLGLEVPDIEAAFEGLPDDAETFSDPQTTATGSQICFLRDPEGNLVELLEF
ncbi:MAG: VOC family protein [Haloarculaceae archaeon]